MASRELPKYLTTEEIDALFAVIKDPRDRAMFRLAYHRGLRASEIGKLDLAHWRPASSRLYVTRVKRSNSGEFRLTRLEEISLRAWIRERGTAPGPLFPSRQRGRITRQRLDQLMRRYGAEAAIPLEKRHMHALKHSCGTHLLELGEEITTVQDHLGHRNIQNTMIYAAITNRVRDAAGERLREWGGKKAA